MGTPTVTLKKSSRDNICQFCDKGYSSEKTLSSHMCIRKRRYTDKDSPGCKLGFRIFQRFYELTTNSKTPKTEMEFIKSKYYLDFVKFARYLIDLEPLACNLFVDFVLKNGVKMKDWEKSFVYESFLQEYTKKEPVEKALERTIIEMSAWADKTGNNYYDFFRQVNPVEATYMLRSARISPWVLYLSQSSRELLGKLNKEQGELIASVIDPNFWNKEFSSRLDDALFVKSVLEEAGI